MSRWLIEKSGTGIEKSGTGIEKSGTGIEKSGTGIEKSGTGIEKAGTGIRKGFLACSLAAVAFTSSVNAGEQLDPAGALQLVVDRNTIAVSWIVDGSVFSGVASLSGTYANLVLTEVGLADQNSDLLIAGSGTGSNKEIAGSGTGSSKEIAGSGTGSSKEIAGSGTGSSKEIAGSGTGVEIAGSGTGVEIAGSGTGLEIAGSGTGLEIAGSGTGTEIAGSGTGTEIAGSGTGNDTDGISSGSTILIAGSGTGAEAITITLPDGTGLQMEMTLGCKTASVSILDANYAEVVTFPDVPVIGVTGFCERDAFRGFDDVKLPVRFGDGRY